MPPITSLRTVQTHITEYMPECRRIVQSHITKMFLQFKANPDYAKYLALQKIADKAGIRVIIDFPENLPNKMVMHISDRKNPTISELFGTIIPNLFRTKKNQQNLKTMTAKEGKEFLVESIKGLFKKNPPNNYVKIIKFSPDEPYANRFHQAIREIANERLWNKR